MPTGEVDWDAYTAKLQEWGPLVAGLLFGAGAQRGLAGVCQVTGFMHDANYLWPII